MRVNLTSGHCQVITSWDDVLAGGRSLTIHDGALYFFQGSHYLYRFDDSIRPASNRSWKAHVGEIWKVVGSTVQRVAQTGRTGFPQPLVLRDEEYVLDSYGKIAAGDKEELGPQGVDPYFSIRGGTASPIIPKTSGVNEFFFVPGFGDTRELGKNLIANKDVDDIKNFNLYKMSTIIENRIPVLEVNGKTGWALIQEVAQFTRSRVGFRGTQFRCEPAAPRTVKVKTALTASAHTLETKDATWISYPARGTILIGSELMTYTGRSGANFTGLTRGVHDTTPAIHAVDATGYFIESVIDDFLSLSLATDVNQYNEIRVQYGDEQEYVAKDTAAINRDGRRELTIPLPLGDEQTLFAKYIADQYLAEFKNQRTIVTLSIPADYELHIGDLVYIRQTERAHLTDVAQIVEIKHTIAGKNRNLSQTTQLKAVVLT